MISSTGSALQLFVDRLASRSVLTDDERATLLAMNGAVKHLPTHSEFIRLGEHVDHSCIIVDGLAGRFGQTREGERQITCLYIPGDMADLPSVVNPKSAWGLTALTPTTILRVPHSDLRRIAASHPGLAEAFWRDCVADGSIFSEWVVNVGQRDALGRLSHLICEMAIRYELAGLGDRKTFPLPITQAGLGEATALTSVHVNRTVRELRERSLATVGKGAVTIHDWDKLVSLGDFDDAFMMLDGPSPRYFEAA